jgi:Tol biopolymer transport system component
MMSNQENITPSTGDPQDPKVNADGKEIVTNKDETNQVTNNDGLTADSDGIQETLTEDDPTFDLNADKETITNNDAAGDELSPDDIN